MAAQEGDPLWEEGNATREEIIAAVRAFVPAHPFRSTYAYQNLLYVVAGALLEALTGTMSDHFVQREIV